VRASAELVAVGDPARLVGLRGEPPLLLRRTGTAGDGAAVVHLVGGAAGPLAGDRLELTVDVGAGSAVEIRSVAATVALPGRSADWSTLTMTARVGPGATLRWLPEPLIAAAGCRHVSRAEIHVAAGGRLLWRDEIVCGRHGEAPGDLRTELDVRYDGRPLLAHDLAVGPDAPGWAGAAVLGDARAVGCLLEVGTDLDRPGPVAGRPPGRPPGPGPTAATMPLAGPGRLTVAVGVDGAEVRRYLAHAERAQAVPSTR
jgi:urease accessory protein